MAESLAALGWDDDWAASFSELDRVGARPARVTAQHRDRWTVHGEEGTRAARLVGSGAAQLRPVTGDWVAVVPGPHPSDPSSIVSVLPRRSSVRRGSAGESRSEQVLAANVDRLWIVQALVAHPVPSIRVRVSGAWRSGGGELSSEKDDGEAHEQHRRGR